MERGRALRRASVVVLAVMGLCLSACGSGSGRGAQVAAGADQAELPVASRIGVSIQPLVESGGFLVVDGLAEQPDGSIGTSVWTKGPDTGFSRLSFKGPPMFMPKTWVTTGGIDVAGVTCPQMRTVEDREDEDRWTDLCEGASTSLLHVETPSGRVTTITDDLPGSVVAAVSVVPGPAFTLLEVPPKDFGAANLNMDLYSLDATSGATQNIGTGPFALSCPVADGFLRFTTGSDPASGTKEGTLQVVTADGVGTSSAIPGQPAELTATPVRCAPDGGALYHGTSAVGSWLLNRRNGALVWSKVPSESQGPKGVLAQQADGHTFGFEPISGETRYVQWKFYEQIGGEWVSRGFVDGSDEPDKVRFSGEHALGLVPNGGLVVKVLP